jgi:hypothetical protein
MKTTHLALLILALGLAGCQGRTGAAEKSAAGAQSEAGSPAATGAEADAGGALVRVRAVELRRFEDAVVAPGQWRSAVEAVLSAPAAGTLDSIGVRPGDRVRAGQVLGWLITRESQASLRGARLLQEHAVDAVSRAEAARALELVRRELVRVPLTAPRSGWVTRNPAAAGGELAADAEILAVTPQDGIVFEARITPSDAAHIRVGQQAVVSAKDEAARKALVSRLLPYAGEGDQSFLFWLSSDDVEPSLIGRYGEARIAWGPARTAPAVPDSSVVEDDLTGASSIDLVLADRRAIHTEVGLGGRSADGWREVLRPALTPGALVLTDGQRGLPDSIRVRWGS